MRLRMKIIQTALGKLTPKQKAKLSQLTLASEGSLMKSTLYVFDKYPEKDQNKIKIVIASDNLDKWIAWALVRPWYSRQLVMVYVLPSHRRQGIGKSLIKHLRESEEFDCYPWDPVSYSFFEAMGLRHWRDG